MITPCGMYMNPRRTGGLYAVPLRLIRPAHRFHQAAAPARRPVPCRQVRRLISKLLRMWILLRIVEATMGERIAGHDPDHERLHAIAVLRDRVGKLIDDDLVIPFQLPAEGVGKKFTGQVAAEIIGARGDDPS